MTYSYNVALVYISLKVATIGMPLGTCTHKLVKLSHTFIHNSGTLAYWADVTV